MRSFGCKCEWVMPHAACLSCSAVWLILCLSFFILRISFVLRKTDELRSDQMGRIRGSERGRGGKQEDFWHSSVKIFTQELSAGCCVNKRQDEGHSSVCPLSEDSTSSKWDHRQPQPHYYLDHNDNQLCPPITCNYIIYWTNIVRRVLMILTKPRPHFQPDLQLPFPANPLAKKWQCK